MFSEKTHVETSSKNGNSSAFKLLLETLLLALRVCTGFTTDVIWVNTKVYGVTGELTQSSSRRVSSFNDSSALLNN